ncbi:Lipid A 3-O-deacylase (PagL) [Ruegeria intermedia]|uniref:Lipid A 3-O-deacylase (PagL) n=1 Tax=Ruegeria intermedia TaxID=996115 RepID=A0A1M4WGH7_9RHOB|nr:acyloxyacyl hydrolase [Ruegeria intermedia]SHE80260.1 Lipid A 3-O-deacylase (PagL) [Ruegeria intermedia]
MVFETIGRTIAVVGSLLTFAPGTANSAEWVAGLGADDLFDIDGVPAFAGLVELHSDPFVRAFWVDVSAMASVLVDTEHDIFAGIGLHSLLHFGMDRVFFEFSLAAGGYFPGGESPPRKLTDRFQYRTSIGAGYRLTESSRLSVSMDHLFNSEFENYEPGSETILLRYTKGF